MSDTAISEEDVKTVCKNLLNFPFHLLDEKTKKDLLDYVNKQAKKQGYRNWFDAAFDYKDGEG